MIVIGFSRSRNLTGWLIRKATGGRFNHVWIGYTDPTWGGQWVTHAVTEGVTIQQVEHLRKKYEKSICFQVIGGVDMCLGMRATRGYIGKEYDFRSVILNGLWLVLYRLTGHEWFNAIVDHNRVSCSEFVATILKRGGFSAIDRDPELYPPDGEMGLYPLLEAASRDMRLIDFEAWSMEVSDG